MTTTTAPFVEQPAPPAGRSADRAITRRLLRGRPGDPAWVRPGLLGLLAVTAALYLWDLSASGWANSFYAAAVQAGTHSWKAFFFGSSDAANFITVDKPPASLWLMEIPARIFGLNSWTLLGPQALEGIAAVGLLYLTVRRAASAGAGLLAGAVLALTPVAALMFRYDNPDALLVLLLVGAAYATTRYLGGGRSAWLVAAGVLVGLGFLTKSLQAFLVVPVLAGAVLAGSARPWRRRVRDLLVSGAALLVAGGWWVAVVELTPAADRPYIGGSQDNSLFNLIFGYNGFGRLTGNETGSVGGGGAAATGQWGPTGLTRLFNSSFGGQISWLLPTALVLLVLGLVLTRRAGRTDRARAGLLIWGGWLVVTGLVFSLSKGIIHPYYTVALAPAIGALIGIGAARAWAHRSQPAVRLSLAAAVGLAAVWSYVLLDRSPTWHPWLRDVVVVGGMAAAVALAFLAGRSRRVRVVVAALAVVAGLTAPLASTLSTVTTAHTGAIPSAGPTVAATFGGGGFGRGRFQPGAFGRGAGSPGGRPFAGGGVATGPPNAGTFGGGAGARVGRRSGQGGGAGGLLGSSTPSAALVKLLEQDHSAFTWVAATTGSENASGYQLATGDPVMSIGGFNGTDPAPTLAAFERDVAAGRIHWYIAGGLAGGSFGGGRAVTGGGAGPTASASTSDDASRIAAWVQSHFTARSVGGVTVYDLAVPAR